MLREHTALERPRPPRSAADRQTAVVLRDTSAGTSSVRLRNGAVVELGASFGGSRGLFPPGYLAALRAEDPR